MGGHESKEHYFLKSIGYEILRNKYNINEDDIKFEYPFKNRVLDIVGIINGRLIVIECGTLNYQKYLDLKKWITIKKIINITSTNYKEYISIPPILERLLREVTKKDNIKQMMEERNIKPTKTFIDEKNYDTKEIISITIEEEVFDFLEEEVRKKNYANRSHAVSKIVMDKKNAK